MFKYRATVKKIVDADTLDMVVDLGFDVSLDVRVRLHGLNAPEIFGVKKDSEEYNDGIEAKHFVEDWVASREKNGFVIKSHDGSKIFKGKFGRWIVEVFDSEYAKTSLNDLLISAGYAKPVLY